MSLVAVKIYAHVFSNKENGTPDSITRKGCVALARMGAKFWNEWRNDYPVEGGVQNSGYGVVSSYGNYADFGGVVFDRSMDFSKFNFGANANFEGAHFLKEVKFTMAKFEDKANFSWAKFSSSAHLDACLFDGDVNFLCAHFQGLAYFSYSRIRGRADFSGVTFLAQTTFKKLVFGTDLCFEFAQFNGWPADFSAGSRDEVLSVFGVEEAVAFDAWVSERGRKFG